MLQTSVEIVNPGGTGRPAFVISARPAPFPPSRSFMMRLPSAFPLPKKYTHFLARPALSPAVFPAFFFAISVRGSICRPSYARFFRDDFRDVGDVQHHVAQV